MVLTAYDFSLFTLFSVGVVQWCFNSGVCICKHVYTVYNMCVCVYVSVVELIIDAHTFKLPWRPIREREGC